MHKSGQQLPSPQLSADSYLATDDNQQEIIGNYYQHLQAISGGQARVDRLAIQPVVRYLTLIYFHQGLDPEARYRPAVGRLLLEIVPYIIGTQSAGNQRQAQRENAAASESVLLTAIEQGLLTPVQRFCSSEPLIPGYQPSDTESCWSALGRAWGSAPRDAETTPYWTGIYTILHCSGWNTFLDDSLTNVAGALVEGSPELEPISEHHAVDISPGRHSALSEFLRHLNALALSPKKNSLLSHSLGQIIAKQCQNSARGPESLTELFPELLQGMRTTLFDLSAALSAKPGTADNQDKAVI